jgi:hypothetical protein
VGAYRLVDLVMRHGTLLSPSPVGFAHDGNKDDKHLKLRGSSG